MTADKKYSLLNTHLAVIDIGSATGLGCAKTSEVADMLGSSHDTALRLLHDLESLKSISKLNTGNCFLWYPVETSNRGEQNARTEM